MFWIRNFFLDSEYKAGTLAIAITFWVLSASMPLQALEPFTASPLHGIEVVRLEVVLGGALDPVHDTGPELRLFRGDLDRASAFERSLRMDIEQALSQCGVRVADDAVDVLDVTVYGRTVPGPNRRDYALTMLELSIIDNSDLDCGRGALEVPAIRTLLGFVPDEELEDSLTSQVRQILVETARCRASKEDASSPREDASTKPTKD